MSTTRIEPRYSEETRSRAIRVLEIEHDFIRRYARLVREIYAREEAWQLPARISQLVLDFGEDFIESRHHAREERILHAAFAADDAVSDARMMHLDDERDDMRARLEGMRRALEEDGPGAATSFGWNAQALANRLLLHLNLEEAELMPLLESRLGSELDARLARDLGLDEAANLTEYAQAENVLLILASL